MKKEDIQDKFAHIPGWGMDADPKNEPTYPYKTYTGDDHNRLNWDRPENQTLTVEVLRSTEHPRYPAVFGTASPPSGLSGMIRRKAFKYSENRYRHWLPLLLADRIDVLEGNLKDLSRGRIPGFFSERGWGALWKLRPWFLVKKIVLRLLLWGAILALIIFRRRK